MGPFDPRVEDLPAAFAVFPLEGALLLPRGRLPLNIFEPRYLAMTEDALGEGRMMAMIQPDYAAAEWPNGPALYSVGCLGRLSSFSETDDGRFLITLTGLIRFAVVRELDMRRGYRRVCGDFASYQDDLAEAADAPIGVSRTALLEALRGYFARRGVEANWESIGRISDAALVLTLSMSCPFAPAEKQALLEARTPQDRAAALLALLAMGAASDDVANRKAC